MVLPPTGVLYIFVALSQYALPFVGEKLDEAVAVCAVVPSLEEEKVRRLDVPLYPNIQPRLELLCHLPANIWVEAVLHDDNATRTRTSMSEVTEFVVA